MSILKQVKYAKILDQTFGLTPSGTIYRATHGDTTQPLLVKVVSKERAAEDDQFLKNLKREYFIIQTLRSLNVFPYLDFIETPQNYYIVCQHTAGPSLEEYIEKEPPLNEANILTHFLQILNGYAEFFKINTPHMNISPKTIYFDLTSKTLKLIPFYLAKSFQMKKHVSPVSSFMAPEFLSNPEIEFTYKCDLWSLGAVLFFITFKTVPFKGDTAQELMFNLELLLKDVVRYSVKCDSRKFSAEFKEFLECFFQKNPSFRIDPAKMTVHPCLVNQKLAFENVLAKRVKSLYGKFKEEGAKNESLKLLLSMIENKDLISKEKNLKILESLDKDLEQPCRYIRLYNECSAIYQGNWIEKSTSPKLVVPNSASVQPNKGPSIGPQLGSQIRPSLAQNVPAKPKMFNRGATVGDIGDIPMIDEEEDESEHKSPDLKSLKKMKGMGTLKEVPENNKKVRNITKSKTVQNIANLRRATTVPEIEENNLDMTEEEGLKSIIPKYYNELDFYNFLFESVESLKEMEKEFKEEVILVRFSIIKWIIFRYQTFEKKVLEKGNIFALPFWDNLKNSKEYLKIMEIVPQKQDKTKWNDLYQEYGEQTDSWLDDLYKKGELNKFSANEKHFLEREKLLHVIMFYARNFTDAIQSLVINLLKAIKKKDEDMKVIGGKANPKFFRVGLVMLKILEINKMVGFDRFDRKMKHFFREIRESLNELSADKIEVLFKQGLEGLLRALMLKNKELKK